MPSENDRFQHNKIDNTALPYISNASVIEARPHWIPGSSNVVASVRGWMERRPGLSAYTADSYPSPTIINRWFAWQRWNGAFYVMQSVTDGPNGGVNKQRVGTDALFVNIISAPGVPEPFDFVESNNFVFFGNGTSMYKYDGTTVTNWGIAPPPATATPADLLVEVEPTSTSGLVPGAIGHRYIYTYGVAATGYISDVSAPSALTTLPLQQWTVTGARCPDPQCDQIHVYRTEDGGSVYLELPNSPIANPGAGNWTLVDNAADISLQQSKPAPLPGVNAPPPGLKGFRFWAGRIWGFKDDSVYFSTFEENTTSVPEECFGQKITNSRAFGSQVMGLGKTPDFLLVFTARGIYRISGDSLNNFTYSQLSHNLGVRNRACIAEYDDKVCWLDMSNTIQVTDGYTIAKDDISLPIRPDIENVVHATASMAAYSVGRFKWLVFCDANAVRVFDFTMSQWNPPWTIPNVTAVYTAQIAAGSFRLLVAETVGAANLTLYVNHADWSDAGVAYLPALYVNLFPINRDNPTSVSVLEYVSIERNALPLSDVGLLTDDDFTTGVYVSIFANETDPANRINGANLLEKWYWANTPAAQRVSAYLKWAAANSKFILYAIDLIYRKVN